MLTKRYLGVIAVMLLIPFFSCKKAKQSIIEDLMIKLITENVWVVTKFNVDNVSITNDFNGYEFVFNKDNSVRARKAGQADVVGSWVGSESAQSINSNFPGAAYPINKLNGIWLITNTDLSPKLVDSKRTEGSSELVMRLNAK